MSSEVVRRRRRKEKAPEDILKDKTPQQLRAMLVVDDEPEFATHAGLRLWTAALWIPRFALITKVASVIALMASLMAMVALWQRDPALLLMASPTGLTRCAPAPINPQTGQVMPRPSAHQQICAQLDREFASQSAAAPAPAAQKGK